MVRDTNHFIDRVPEQLRPVFRSALRCFQLSETSDHGPSHWLKVFENATRLAGQASGADLKVCQLFALLHDCQRQTDGTDIQHGPRAADYAMELFDRGDLDITKPQLHVLCEACRDHARGSVSADPTIGVCWDADRLDLPRVGVRIDKRYLSTAAARQMIRTT